MEAVPFPIRRIKLLSDQLINRIAAGEVVERPGAVLKELLENSLDAGADRIEIEVASGGKKLVTVRDNGRGMDKDDLLMCLERHATSKIGVDTDLLKIDTLGFRGEALPSIGAVSNLSITSATEGGPGHQVIVAAGKLIDFKAVAANRGTTVEVRNLFYNVPARRKFLKSEQTESARLLDVVQSYALSREGLRLIYRDGGREILAVEKQQDFKTRVYKILGRSMAENLTPLEHSEEMLKISGWLGSPDQALRSSAHIFIYVLGRPVKDRLLGRALTEGYGRLLAPGAWPAAVIFIDLDPGEVDVNVHPTKAEVRFRQPGDVFAALSGAVSRAVGRAPVMTDDFCISPSRSVVTDSVSCATPVSSWITFGIDEAAAAEPPLLPSPLPSGTRFSSLYPSQVPSNISSFTACLQLSGVGFETLRPLAQLYQSYILAEGVKGLYLIDQHAAHERILFTRLKRDLARNGLPGQNRLFLESADFSPQQVLAAAVLKPYLIRLGFDLEPFGERSFILRSAPAILGAQDPWGPLLEILGAADGRLVVLEGAGLKEALETMADSWLYSLACRASIKAGDKMTMEAMTRLIEDMAVTPNGAYCPHGRPAIQLIERRTIETRFLRK